MDIRVTGAETDDEEELLSLLRSLRFEACYPDLRSAGSLSTKMSPIPHLTAKVHQDMTWSF